MSYTLFAWITTIFYAASGLVGKFAAKHKITNPWLYNFVWSLVVVIISVGVALWYGGRWPAMWGSIVIAGIMSAVTAVTYTLSVYMLDVSVLGPLYIFRTPASVLLGAMFFGETMGAWQLMLIGVMTVAGMFVTMDEKMSLRSFFRKPIAFGLFTVLLSSIYNATVKYAVAQNGYWDTVLWYNIVNQVVLLVTVPLFIKDLKQLKKGDYFHVSLSALFAGIGGITVIPAIAGNLGITMAILALPMGMVSAIVLSYFAPKLLEKHPTKVYAVRLASAAVMFAAGLALSR
jgi:drug/metabolite transporter (DMT)-like permease